jgi:hypothetical protein
MKTIVMLGVNLLGCLFCLVLARAAEPWRVETAGEVWRVKGKIKKDTDISGAVAVSSKVGLLVSDETRAVQFFQYDREAARIVAGESVNLMSMEGAEFDLEGISLSSDGRSVYVTGSHGLGRKSGAAAPERERVFRLPISAGTLREKLFQDTTLLPVLMANEKLRDAVRIHQDKGGLDMEGLAERDGSLFFGVRSPSVAGQAFVVEVRADELFADPLKSVQRTHELSLGEGRGIRDLARVSDGFLVVAGPAGSSEDQGGFTLHHWAGPNQALVRVGSVPAVGKAEGVMVIEETAAFVDVVMFFDGSENGGATALRLVKSTQD